jgi:hypothetical protein
LISENVKTCIKLVLLFLIVSCTANTEVNNQTVNTVQKIIDDMDKCHEALPHGVSEKASWRKCPRLDMGNNPNGFTAMIPWGQVYETVEGNLASNTRVQLRNLETYYLSKKDNKWYLWNGSYKVAGKAYVENFADDISKPADMREEPDGSISVRVGDGFNFHFWTTIGRNTIDPDDIKGVFSTCQARLILHDENGPDDRKTSRYILSIGADYWKDLNVGWDQWKTNGDIGIGRFKYVTNDWDAFNMHSLTEEELRNNPPPLR